MKIKLHADDRQMLFKELSECGYETKAISEYLGVHRRTVADWKRGKYNIEQSSFLKIVGLTKLDSNNLKYTILDPIEQKLAASKLGGRARWDKYGFIGTKDDKILGGLSSYSKRMNDPDDIFGKKHIEKPIFSNSLAEFVGISMGDGSISNYQVSISLNDEDDTNYITFVTKLAYDLFNIKTKLQKRKGTKCTNIVMSSIELVDFLISLGLPKGDKIRAGLDVPEWIASDSECMRSCIRGLFDTDGSIFLETHTIKGKKYSYPRMSFVSASEPLRESVCSALMGLGIGAKIRMDRCVTIERFTDIEKYFRIVGSSNQKHLDRFARFGGVG